MNLCETQLPEEKTTALKSGDNTLYQNNFDSKIRQGGISFLVDKKVSHLKTKFHSNSERVIYITLIRNKKYRIDLIHGYTPISKSEDEEMETSFENLSRALKSEKKERILKGFLNAKIVQKH